jgi:hypothetical protein
LYRIRSPGAHVAHTKSEWSAHAMPDLYEAEIGELARSGQEETRVRREHLHPAA